MRISHIVGLLATTLLLTTQTVSFASAAGLRVEGNRIVDTATGQPVQLRGVNRSGTEYMCLGGSNVFDGPADQASVDAMKTWAISVVRLPVNEDCWLGINGVPAATSGTPYRSAITSFVNLLADNGIASIIDLQWAAPGTTLSRQLTPMPDADHAVAFWASAAATFKGHDLVMFDLFNEPFPDNNRDSVAAWTCLRDGGTCPGVDYQTVGTQTLVDTIRGAGATNIILVPGVQYTNSVSQWLTFAPNDPLHNLAVAWHSYAGQACSTPACFDSTVAPVLAAAPLIATEIGQNDCQHAYIDQLMDWLDQHDGNYLGWAWNTYDCGSFPSLIANFGGTPTSFGLGLRNHFLTRAGRPTPTPVPIPMLTDRYPFGINVGSTAAYTASDGTVFLPDVPGPGLQTDVRYFEPYVVTDAITGSPDPALFQKGRAGVYGTWTINVPNGTYLVTLGMAPTSTHAAGEFGQDQSLQGQKLGTCVWTSHSGEGGCPPNQSVPPPVLGQAATVAYTVQVVDQQQLVIQAAASFGDGRQTLLDMIRVAPAPVEPTPVASPTVVASVAPTVEPGPEPTMTPTDPSPPDAGDSVDPPADAAP